MTTTITGIITAITFQNEDNGYTVLQLQADGMALPVTCVGTMPTVAAGESLRIQGSWEEHRRFGRQFIVERYEIVRPTTLDGIVSMLGSGLIANIGPVRARLIADTFGLATLEILDREPDRLTEVRGIGKKTLDKIKDAWQRQRHVRELMLFLQEWGVSANMAGRIYKAYGQQAREKISGDPYSLVEDVWGIGFIKADQIAQKMGFKHDSYKRIRAGISHLLTEAAASDGHSFLPAETLVTHATELLGVTRELVVYSLDHAIQAGLFVRENDRIFLPAYHNAEKKIAEILQKKITATTQSSSSSAAAEGWLKDYQHRTGWTGDPKQAEAISAALSRPIFLLTGGPGTGKTTILQVIVSFFRQQRKLVVLAAPTGRAAQRMGNVSGLAAQTIHRLLEFRPNSGTYRFERNERNPIEADALIIDEMSMIDLLLMRSLMVAVKPHTALIFVGDSNQLPSVGAGNVLADLIASGIIPHVHLTTIFRQAAASRIVTAAHEIISGAIPAFSNATTDNCFFIEQEDPDACAETIVSLVAKRLPGRYGLDPVSDIQVLSPMHKGPLGTQNLTALLQKALNSSDRKISRGAVTFFLGDKVLQIRNNYDLEVFNGDIGIVASVDEEQGLMVNFDGRTVRYGPRDLDELVPAYCMSVHKSQGCEFRAVVIPLATQHYILLQRNLIYTALTRARQLCVLVGTYKALAIAVRNKQAAARYSSLSERLRDH